jgi:hypothetical protein
LLVGGVQPVLGDESVPADTRDRRREIRGSHSVGPPSLMLFRPAPWSVIVPGPCEVYVWWQEGKATE